jgi:UDP-N-acetylglucosamine 2-epimerase
MKILSIVGARPEFIQAMPVSRVLREKHREILVHTGQHYDYRMSQAFFDELDIPTPDYNLEVGSGTHARQTAEILIRLEEVLIKEQPDLVIVRGDTNSTLAGAIAPSKLHIPLAHIEAGERSFERRMPEELNRLVADRLANIHFCVSDAAIRNLAEEGIRESVHLVGDVMLDAHIQVGQVARRKSTILSQLCLQPRQYCLVTLHRSANTDSPERLRSILSALDQVEETIIFPVHPRTRKAVDAVPYNMGKHLHLIEPVGYLDMLVLEENARLIATDSGGVQREAYFCGIPCLTLRDETEWGATLTTGWNRLVGADTQKILEAWNNFQPPAERPPIFGFGSAALRISEVIG